MRGVIASWFDNRCSFPVSQFSFRLFFSCHGKRENDFLHSLPIPIRFFFVNSFFFLPPETRWLEQFLERLVMERLLDGHETKQDPGSIP